ncbi:MAG: hypothetical protein KDK30_15470, partial [Leptospiraceae bacterium]|nr:hypothetical protein [Leptospiraceae bacterium]
VLREVAKYNCVREIDMVELDGRVVEIARAHLGAIHGGAFADPRLSLHITDGRRFVEAHPKTYDAILMDMTDPQGPSALLYTREFLSNVRSALRNTKGVFCMHAESPDDRPWAFASIIKTNRSVFKYTTCFYQYLQQYGANWCFAVSSPAIDVGRVRPRIINRRLKKNGVGALKVYTGESHYAMQVSRPYIDAVLRRTDARILTDAEPEFNDRFE